jgi:myo-inositol-1(or 4)-monophosphatase
MHGILNIAIRAARSAGSIILRNVDRIDALKVSQKGRNDFVSEVDQNAEQEIIRTIHRSYPNHAVLAEESGTTGNHEFVWIIDPLDGTTNFLHGFPVFAVSIAVQRRGQLEYAVIFDPMRNELFTAVRGSGATRNDRRIRVTNRTGLEGSLLGTGFPFRGTKHLDNYLATFRELFLQSAGIRRAGAAALDLAYVATGRLDGFWEIGLKPWDIAAGALLIREAGGTVTDFAGGANFLDTGNVLAGNLKVHAAMGKIIRPLLPAELRR